MYLFVVHFLFAPVISASIHRYVNYFDIPVLMMVTETETLNVDFTSWYPSPDDGYWNWNVERRLYIMI